MQGNREKNLTQDEVQLLKRTVAKGTSDDEFALFLWVCRKHRVDPLTRQIYCIMRWDKKHHKDEKDIWVGGNKMVIQMGIDGFRSLAARNHKDYGDCEEPEYEFYDPKQYAGTGTKKEIPSKATIKFWKRGSPRPTVGTAYWDEYAPDLNGESGFFWAKMPKHMLAKCAEALALRKAYPDMADIYTTEEMHQAQDHTEGGRQIVDEQGFAPSGRAVTDGARNRQNMIEDRPKTPKEERREEHAAASEKRVEDLDAVLAVSTDVAELVEKTGIPLDQAQRIVDKNKQLQANRESAKAPIEVKPEEKPPETLSKGKPVGHIEIDLSGDEADPILRGDLEVANALDRMRPYLKGLVRKDDWWHIAPEDVNIVAAFCKQCNFELITVPHKKENPGKKERKKEAVGSVKGMVYEVSDTRKTAKDAPFIVVKVGKVSHQCWSKSSIPWITEHAKGKDCEFTIDSRHAIIGIVRIGTVLFRDGNPVGPL